MIGCSCWQTTVLHNVTDLSHRRRGAWIIALPASDSEAPRAEWHLAVIRRIGHRFLPRRMRFHSHALIKKITQCCRSLYPTQLGTTATKPAVSVGGCTRGIMTSYPYHRRVSDVRHDNVTQWITGMTLQARDSSNGNRDCRALKDKTVYL